MPSYFFSSSSNYSFSVLTTGYWWGQTSGSLGQPPGLVLPTLPLMKYVALFLHPWAPQMASPCSTIQEPSCELHLGPTHLYKWYTTLPPGLWMITHHHKLDVLTSLFCLFLLRWFLTLCSLLSSSSSRMGFHKNRDIEYSSIGASSSRNIITTKFTSFWLKGLGFIAIFISFPFSLPFMDYW